MDPGNPLSDALGRPLTVDQERLLRVYARLLAAAATHLNLTAVRDPAGIERRHLVESLALVRVLEAEAALPEGGSAIDVGSGGGLPGIPLAVVRPDLRVTLLEATGKKAAFLSEALTALGLTEVSVIAARAEAVGHDPAWRERFDLALARAVAPLNTLVELTLPLVAVGGRMAAVKGSRVHDELTAAAAAIRRCGGRLEGVEHLPVTDESPLSVVLIVKAQPTPPQFPRRSGMPAKRPLT